MSSRCCTRHPILKLLPMAKMNHVPPSLIALMRASNAPRTDEGLQQAFGISYNTWRRIDAGAAIRALVAERLIARLAAHERSAER